VAGTRRCNPTVVGDGELRCIVVRGAGERAFSPGNDIAEFALERANSAQARAYGAVMHATLRALA
jgi:enoyl-CoA hydratase/carnithine racemase